MASQRGRRRTRSKSSRRRRSRRSHSRSRIQRGGDGTNRGLLDEANAPAAAPAAAPAPAPTSPLEFTVRFEPSVQATPEGGIVSLVSVQPEPYTYWTPPSKGTSYTLVCWDPDAPAKSWLHWLVVNCHGRNPSSGNTLVSWSPPAPPKGTGQHRYIFGLFQQARPLEKTAAPAERGGFHLETFVTHHQLTPLIYKGLRVNAVPAA